MQGFPILAAINALPFPIRTGEFNLSTSDRPLSEKPMWVNTALLPNLVFSL
jgi:hypothetical protein